MYSIRQIIRDFDLFQLLINLYILFWNLRNYTRVYRVLYYNDVTGIIYNHVMGALIMFADTHYFVINCSILSIVVPKIVLTNL